MHINTTPQSSRRARIAGVLAVVTAFLLLGIGAALALPAGGAASAHPADSSTTTTTTTPATTAGSTSVTVKPALGVYFGEVRATEPACQLGRTVQLLHVEQGSDRVVGTAESDGSGHWAVHTDPNMTGSFYAVATEAAGCDETTSQTVESIAIPVMG